MLSVILEEPLIRDESFWHAQKRTFIIPDQFCFFDWNVGNVPCHDNLEGIINGDQPLVKRPVVECIQAQTILWVHPIFRIYRPWNNMAGYEQFGDSHAGNAASAIIGSKNHLSEKALVDPCPNHGFPRLSLRQHINILPLFDWLIQ